MVLNLYEHHVQRLETINLTRMVSLLGKYNQTIAGNGQERQQTLADSLLFTQTEKNICNTMKYSANNTCTQHLYLSSKDEAQTGGLMIVTIQTAEQWAIVHWSHCLWRCGVASAHLDNIGSRRDEGTPMSNRLLTSATFQNNSVDGHSRLSLHRSICQKQEPVTTGIG